MSETSFLAAALVVALALEAQSPAGMRLQGEVHQARSTGAGPASASDTIGLADSLRVVAEHGDSSTGAWIRDVCTTAMRGIQVFFGSPFTHSVTVRVFPNRAALTAYWRSAWGVPDLTTECWQVASGTASLLAILSPRVWRTEACEHDPADSGATRLLIAHELVHVFHAWRNPHPEFDGMDEISWLVEGIATYASGQLDRIHAQDARTAIESGAAPVRLATAWSGKYRYGVAGSLVKYLDVTYGRGMLVGLLSVTSEEELLGRVGVSEEVLLNKWRAWVLARRER